MKINQNNKEFVAEDDEVAVLFFFYFENYDGFLLKTGVNYKKHNILRRFSITALKCAS